MRLFWPQARGPKTTNALPVSELCIRLFNCLSFICLRFCVVLSLLFCSGGGYWYRKRYLQRRFMIGQPQTNAVVTMTQSSTASADGTCTRIPTGTQQQQQQLLPLTHPPPLPTPSNTEDEGTAPICSSKSPKGGAIHTPLLPEYRVNVVHLYHYHYLSCCPIWMYSHAALPGTQ